MGRAPASGAAIDLPDFKKTHVLERGKISERVRSRGRVKVGWISKNPPPRWEKNFKKGVGNGGVRVGGKFMVITHSLDMP